MTKFINLQDKRFNSLTAISSRIGKNGSGRIWQCKCDCGNQKEYKAYQLINKPPKDCGCSKKDLIGLQFGKLLVLEKVKIKQGVYKYKCQCTCGKIFLTNVSRVENRKNYSCGCDKNNRKLPPNEAEINALIRAYKKGAQERDLLFYLDRNQCINFFQGNCYYCGVLPKQIKQFHKNDPYFYNGIDRINSKEGYLYENCVSCCKICNIAKSSLTEYEFYHWIQKVYEYNVDYKFPQLDYFINNDQNNKLSKKEYVEF